MFLFKSRDPYYLDNIFEDFFKIHTCNYEYCNYIYDNGNLDLKINVPGYGKEDLNLFLQDNVLVLESKDKKLYKKYEIPKHLDFDSVESKCEKGILHITGKALEENNKKLLEIK